MSTANQYFLRFLDLILTDPRSMVRHRLANFLPKSWLNWAIWFSANRDLVALSKSQCAQDLYCLFILETRFGLNLQTYRGKFIEFGGFDGLTHSNSFSLEQLGWSGTILEPDRTHAAECKKNRKCRVLHAAVVGNDGPERVEFVKNLSDGELSHLAGYGTNRSKGTHIMEKVSTISLDALLEQEGAVDILSMDTEGSEADILETSELKIAPRMIVVEHNYDKERRQRIRRRLEGLGYNHVVRYGNYFDDYYAK